MASGTAPIKSRLLITTDGEPNALDQEPANGWSFHGATTHPGVVLEEEFLKPMNLTRHKLALDLRVPPGRIGLIVDGKRGVTPDTALRLARYFGTSPEFWLNLQLTYDLSRAKAEIGKTIEREVNSMVG